MIKIFQVENVKCGACAATLKNKLGPEFGEIEVNLDTHPREITVEIEEDQVDALQEALRSLGYPLSTDEVGFVENTTAKVKSFVSCAVGKIEGEDG
jgi:copper chaperone CopZ